jgi:glutathione S-transferase
MGGAPGLLTEVPAIMYYLAARHPEAELLPIGAAAAARCFEWFNWLSGSVHAMSYGQIWRTQRFSDDEQAFASIREKGRRSLEEQYRYIDSLLGDGRQWAGGDRYSIVDPFLLVFFGWGQRIGMNMRSDFPAWSGLVDRLLERPAVARVLEKEGVSIATA